MLQMTTPGGGQFSEDELWADYWRAPGCTRFYQRLIEHYLPMVARMISRLARGARDRIGRDELLSSGIVGLHQAVKHYTPEHGVPFPGFAGKRIRGAVLDDLRRRDHLTRQQRHTYRAICDAIQKLAQKLSRAPTTAEIAAEIDMTSAQVTKYIDMGHEPVSLNSEIGDGLCLLDGIADEHTPSPSDLADRAIAREQLGRAYLMLPKRDQQVLFLLCHEKLRVREVAEALGVSDGRVSQIYKEIVLKLRTLLRVQPADIARHG